MKENESGEMDVKKPSVAEISEFSVIDLLGDVNRTLCERLDEIEAKLESISNRCCVLEEKFNSCLEYLQNNSNYNKPYKTSSQEVASSYPSLQTDDGEIIIAVPRDKSSISASAASTGDAEMMQLMTSCTLIQLNSEDSYPEGSWLGDEENVCMRVRVNISPSDLHSIHLKCKTAEKMALALLDVLFDKEVQAISNISGSSKHGKSQLDPLLIYGIRCHLIHRFSISEEEWKHLCVHIDSKCRSTFRRKMNGLPLKRQYEKYSTPCIPTKHSKQEISALSHPPSNCRKVIALKRISNSNDASDVNVPVAQYGDSNLEVPVENSMIGDISASNMLSGILNSLIPANGDGGVKLELNSASLPADAGHDILVTDCEGNNMVYSTDAQLLSNVSLTEYSNLTEGMFHVQGF